MKSENLKKLWQSPMYRDKMRLAHLGQKAWNKGLKVQTNTGRTHFQKGQPRTEAWYEAMRNLRGKNSSRYKHGLSGTQEYTVIQQNNRRARKLENGGRFTTKEWIKLKEKYENRCAACDRLGDLVADHVIPLSKGGPNSIENIQPLCQPCNNKKYTKDTDYRHG